MVPAESREVNKIKADSAFICFLDFDMEAGSMYLFVNIFALFLFLRSGGGRC